MMWSYSSAKMKNEEHVLQSAVLYNLPPMVDLLLLAGDQLLSRRHVNLNFPLSFPLQTAGMCECDRCVAGSVYSTDSPLITLTLSI